MAETLIEMQAATSESTIMPAELEMPTIATYLAREVLGLREEMLVADGVVWQDAGFLFFDPRTDHHVLDGFIRHAEWMVEPEKHPSRNPAFPSPLFRQETEFTPDYQKIDRGLLVCFRELASTAGVPLIMLGVYAQEWHQKADKPVETTLMHICLNNETDTAEVEVGTTLQTRDDDLYFALSLMMDARKAVDAYLYERRDWW